MAKGKNKGFVSNARAFDNYSKGWSLLKSNFWPLITAVLVTLVIDLFIRILSNISSTIGNFIHWSLAIIMPLLIGFGVGFLVLSPIHISLSWLFLKAARKENFNVADVFAAFSRNYWNVVLAPILVSILAIIGLILLIIPGIIVMIRMSFIGYLLMDKKLSAVEAIKASWKITKGHSWTILGMWLISIPIFIVGFLCLFVGIIPALVWVHSSFAVLYYSVSSR